jgi:hypothetical protein
VHGRQEQINGRSGGTTVDPADRVTLDESINMAFLVVLESMTPAHSRCRGVPNAEHQRGHFRPVNVAFALVAEACDGSRNA